jgi:spore coat protein U-like protein
VSIRIEMAQGSSSSFAPRHMYGGVSIDDLEYNIYLDSTHRQVWGTGEGPTLAYVDAHPPNGTPVIVPAFARIFGGQDISWGPYTDTVPVRILF